MSDCRLVGCSIACSKNSAGLQQSKWCLRTTESDILLDRGIILVESLLLCTSEPSLHEILVVQLVVQYVQGLHDLVEFQLQLFILCTTDVYLAQLVHVQFACSFVIH